MVGLNILQPQTRHCVLCMKSDGIAKHWSMQCVGEVGDSTGCPASCCLHFHPPSPNTHPMSPAPPGGGGWVLSSLSCPLEPEPCLASPPCAHPVTTALKGIGREGHSWLHLFFCLLGYSIAVAILPRTGRVPGGHQSGSLNEG